MYFIVFFLIDIFVSFYTTYNENGVYVTDRNKIREHYIHTWFPLDLIATIPFDLILMPFLDATTLRWVRFSRLLRLAKFGKLLKGVQHLSIFAAMTLLLTVFGMLGHWNACIWFLIGTFEKDNDYESWLNQHLSGKHIFFYF